MSEQLRAAAERLRRIEACERRRTVYGFDDEEMDDFMYRMLENRYEADLRTLAQAWLAEHPADSELSIDESWLESVGFQGHPRGWCLYARPMVILRSGHVPYLETGLYSIPLAGAHCDTRGDVRRLASALGITLREEPQ